MIIIKENQTNQSVGSQIAATHIAESSSQPKKNHCGRQERFLRFFFSSVPRVTVGCASAPVAPSFSDSLVRPYPTCGSASGFYRRPLILTHRRSENKFFSLFG